MSYINRAGVTEALSTKDEEQKATATEAYLYDIAHSKGNWDMFINELRAYTEKFGINSRIAELANISPSHRPSFVERRLKALLKLVIALDDGGVKL